MLTAFDLFSGGGGFRQGAQRAGMKTIAHCEINKWAEKFYSQAFDVSNEEYYNDATKIISSELPNFDVLLASFPCQAFSIAGKRRGFEDARGTMFFEVARILRDKKPKYFILENVKGLLSHGGGSTFAAILQILSDIGVYSIEWSLLNSKYFGVPQNRERIFIVGYPREYGCGKIFPLAIPTGKNNASTEEVIYWKNSKEKWVQEKRTNVGTIKTQSDLCRQPLIAQLPRGNNKGGLKSECPTITKNQWEYNNILVEKRIRRLTPLECFRLQGYSDEVFLKGSQNISDAQLYKIAGNSVTVNVVYELAKKIMELERSKNE